MSTPFDPDVWQRGTAWLRENHKATARPTYQGAGEWSCECGARNGPGTRLTIRQAEANRDRHLRAARRAYERKNEP